MNKSLISVIVPIYKVEAYLKKCIDSIIENIEIVLIDDGSPDNCGAICDEHQGIDNRIKAIHRENSGLSSVNRKEEMQVVNIYVVEHKPVDLSKYSLDSCYKIICVGEYAQQEVGLMSDCTGDNISYKNSNYCEMTAAYWIWKNDTISDIVGLCHYRRFFTKAAISVDSKYFINENDILKYLKTNDVIVAKKTYSCEGAYKGYLNCGREKDLQCVRNAIEQLCPEYLSFYINYFEKASGLHLANMIISKKQVFDEYCKWLFNILNYVEERTDISQYSKEEARIYGYLAERLLNVWLAKNNYLRVKECRVIHTEKKYNATFFLEELLKFTGIYQIVKNVIFKLRN